MQRMAILWMGGWLVLASTAAAQVRERAPDRVSVVAQAGIVEPVGRFGELVAAGPTVAATGFFRLNDYLAPVVSFQYASFNPDLGQVRASLDSFRVLGGLRVYVVPESFVLRPWIGALGGWALYDAYRDQPELEPVIASSKSSRDDVLLSVGGGMDLRLHPNFEVGFDVRHDTSFTDDHQTGERDLSAVTILGALTFNY